MHFSMAGALCALKVFKGRSRNAMPMALARFKEQLHSRKISCSVFPKKLSLFLRQQKPNKNSNNGIEHVDTSAMIKAR